jgi:hypothetical protein
MERCSTDAPPLQKVEGGRGHVSACWLPPDRVGREAIAAKSAS